MTICCCASPRGADSPGSRDSSLDGNGERERFNAGTPFLHRQLPDDYRPAGYKAPPMPSPLTQTSDTSASPGGEGGTTGASSDGDGDGLESSLLDKSTKSNRSDSNRAVDHDDVLVERRKSVDGSTCGTSPSADLQTSPSKHNPKPNKTSSKRGHHRTGSAPVFSGAVKDAAEDRDAIAARLLRESLQRPASPGLRAGQGAVSGTVIDGGPRAKAADPMIDADPTTRRLASHHRKSMSAASLADDDACCPICFEEYCADNPKTPLVCGHHFHLGCMFDWYERSDRCPVCEEPMIDLDGILVAAAEDD